MASGIEKGQIKRIYAMAQKLGIAEHGNKEDNLHLLVEQITGKASVGQLTKSEAAEVIDRLKCYTSAAPGHITEKQSKMCWAIIYRLTVLSPGEATPGQRLAGAVHKVLGMPPFEKNPLKWVTFEQAEKLIEYLKRYQRSAERRANENRQG